MGTSPLRSVPDGRPEPPAHLEQATAAWFRQVCSDYDLEPHHIRLLVLACEAWDRCQEARAVLERDGIVTEGRFGIRAHPAVAVEKDSRIAFARLVREIDLDGEPMPDPRPPRRGGRR